MRTIALSTGFYRRFRSYGADLRGPRSICLLITTTFFVGVLYTVANSQDSVQWPQKESNYQPRPYQGQLQPDDGQWTRPAEDLASTRYSALDLINTNNVKNLKVAFTFSTGQQRGHEAAPLVVNNTMYIVTPWPDNLFALDLTKPGAPMKWMYSPQPTPASKGEAC